MSLDIDKGINRIEVEYLSEIERLEKLNYKEGGKDKNLLDQKIKHFIQMIDPKKREEYESLFYGLYYLRETEEEKQELYLKDLEKMETYLLALMDYLELQREVSEPDVTDKKIEKLDSEAKRRGKVVETKTAGAAIEIIQSLRNELKRKDEEINRFRNELENVQDMRKEIMELKKDIKEIKDLLKKGTK